MELMDGWLARTRLIAAVGSGGVGKTTTSAAIGLWAATRGRKVMVLTIDPARRLANSLGLQEMGGEAHRVDLAPLGEQVVEGGELWAMMLDSKKVFDGLIRGIAPNPTVRDRILNNHIYRHMADAFAGSQDYMATEQLYDLVRSGKYDLVVLDTPPVKNALDFLESPGRVVNFLDERVLKWFLRGASSGSLASRLLGGTAAVVQRLLGVVFGDDFLADLGDFFEDFQGLYAGFRVRHQAVIEMLRAPGTTFLTVCAPTESSVDIAAFFLEELAKRQLPRAGIIVNQVHRVSSPEHDASGLRAMVDELGADMPAQVRDRLIQRLTDAHRRLADRQAVEQRLVGKVREASNGVGFYREVPRFDEEVHDLPSLLRVGERVFS